RLSTSAPSLAAVGVRARVLTSFPTRRSSDLRDGLTYGATGTKAWQRTCGISGGMTMDIESSGETFTITEDEGLSRALDDHGHSRSEEHTSELQSRFDLVCRLLLEKKKTDGKE